MLTKKAPTVQSVEDIGGSAGPLLKKVVQKKREPRESPTSINKFKKLSSISIKRHITRKPAEFYLFSELPGEIRNEIIKIAMRELYPPSEYLQRLRIPAKGWYTATMGFKTTDVVHYHRLLAVNKEWRSLANYEIPSSYRIIATPTMGPYDPNHSNNLIQTNYFHGSNTIIIPQDILSVHQINIPLLAEAKALVILCTGDELREEGARKLFKLNFSKTKLYTVHPAFVPRHIREYRRILDIVNPQTGEAGPGWDFRHGMKLYQEVHPRYKNFKLPQFRPARLSRIPEATENRHHLVLATARAVRDCARALRYNLAQ